MDAFEVMVMGSDIINAWIFIKLSSLE